MSCRLHKIFCMSSMSRAVFCMSCSRRLEMDFTNWVVLGTMVLGFILIGLMVGQRT